MSNSHSYENEGKCASIGGTGDMNMSENGGVRWDDNVRNNKVL